MFGFRNITWSFFIKAGPTLLEFAAGVTEEIALNITGAAAADAVEIPEDLNLKLIPKDQFITSTSIAVGSKIVGSKVFDLVAGATPNLLI